MDIKEAVEILNQYPDDWFEYELEDAQFGDGSHSIHFNTLFDSKNEAEKVAEAIKILILSQR
jgi:hypothetical protein